MLESGQLREQIRLLDKGDDVSRRQALRALKSYTDEDWGTAPRDMVRSLVESLQRQLLVGVKHKPILQESLTVLGNLGSPSQSAVPQIIELLGEEFPPDLRALAAGSLGKIGCADQRVRGALLSLWQSVNQSQSNRMQVAIALCKLGIKAEGLLRIMTSTLVSHQDSTLRKSAAEALAWCGKDDPDVVPALLTAALNDKDEKVRAVAEVSMTELKLPRKKAIQVCASQLKDSTYAEVALKNSGVDAVPALIEALEASDPSTREKAARTLGSLGEVAAEASKALNAALRDKVIDVRLAAAKGLWNVSKNAEAVGPVLVELLKENHTTAADAGEQRRRHLQTVIEALQRIGPPAKVAVPALIAMTKDKNRHISESAQSALKEISPAALAKVSVR